MRNLSKYTHKSSFPSHFGKFNGALDFWILSNVRIEILKRVTRSWINATSRYNATPGRLLPVMWHVPFLSKDLMNFPTQQITIWFTKTFTGGLSRHTKAKGIYGQLVCLTGGGSIPVTMITRKLFAQLTLGEISSPLGSPDTFHEIYEHSRHEYTNAYKRDCIFSAAEKNVATGEFKNRFFLYQVHWSIG